MLLWIDNTIAFNVDSTFSSYRFYVTCNMRYVSLTVGRVQAADEIRGETEESAGSAFEFHRRSNGKIFHVADGGSQ